MVDERRYPRACAVLQADPKQVVVQRPQYLSLEFGESVFENSLRFLSCGPAEQLFKIEKPVYVPPRNNHTPPRLEVRSQF